MAEKMAGGVTEAKTDTLNPTSGTYKVRNEAGQMVDASPADRLTFTVPNSTYLGGGKVAVLTGDNENLKALAKDGTTELHDVSGYYLFDELPTAVRTWNPTTGKYEYALASYTVEVNGEKGDDGMSSLLVTTFEAETTAHDVVNSRVQPMVTARSPGPGTNSDGIVDVWSRYETNNYPVFLDEQNIQTADEVHSDGSCTIKECETVEGEISKNNAAWRIVLAGLADGASWANQRTAYGWSEKHEAVDANGRPTTETVTGTFDYDFAIGQNQNAMNAGFVPPDRSSLVGQAWYDEDYDGKNDSDTSDDRIDTDDRDKTEQGVEGLRVILTQYYFVPTYDNHGNQLLEDEDNNVFYLDTEHATDDYPNGVLRLVENRGKNVVEGDGGKVYLVRSGRTYDYDALYKAGVRELKDSGYWVENTNFNGGRQYKDGEDVEAPEVPTTPTDPENPGETTDPENPNPENPGETTDPENPGTGEGGDTGGDTRRGCRHSCRFRAPAMSGFALARFAVRAAAEGAEGFADGESTEVTDPAMPSAPTRTRPTPATATVPTTGPATARTAPALPPTSPAPMAMATASAMAAATACTCTTAPAPTRMPTPTPSPAPTATRCWARSPTPMPTATACATAATPTSASTPSLNGRTTSTTPIPLPARSAARRRARRPMWTSSTTRPRLPAPRRRRARTALRHLRRAGHRGSSAMDLHRRRGHLRTSTTCRATCS